MAIVKRDPAEGLGERIADFVARYGPLLILAALPFVVYLPLRTPGRGQEYFLKIATFAVFGVFLLGRLVANLRFKIDVPWIAIVLGLAGATASALLSPSRLYALNSLLSWVAGVMLFIMLRAASRKWDLFVRYSWIFILQALLLAVYGILQNYGHEILPYYETVQKNRVISTFGHPNFFGSYMAPVIFICLARAASPAGKVARAPALVAAAVAAFALLLARARAAWIGTALGLALAGASILWTHRDALLARLTPRRAAGAFGAVAVVAIAALFVIGPGRIERQISRRLGSLPSGSQWETRVYFWYIATGVHSTFSPVGIGRGGFGRVFWDEVDKLQLSPDSHYFRRNHVALSGWQRALDPGNVHNDYLEMWAESGFIALFAHLLLIGYLVYFFALRLWRGAATGDQSASPPTREALMKSFLLGGFVCMMFDALLGFPLALPCSLALFWFYAAMLNQYIDHPER